MSAGLGAGRGSSASIGGGGGTGATRAGAEPQFPYSSLMRRHPTQRGHRHLRASNAAARARADAHQSCFGTAPGSQSPAPNLAAPPIALAMPTRADAGVATDSLRA